MDLAQSTLNMRASQDSTATGYTQPSASPQINYKANLHDSQYSITQRSERLKEMYNSYRSGASEAHSELSSSQALTVYQNSQGLRFEDTQPDGDFIFQKPSYSLGQAATQIDTEEPMGISLIASIQNNKNNSGKVQTTVLTSNTKIIGQTFTSSIDKTQAKPTITASNTVNSSQAEKMNLEGTQAAASTTTSNNSAQSSQETKINIREELTEAIKRKEGYIQELDKLIEKYAKGNLTQYSSQLSQPIKSESIFQTETTRALSTSMNEERSGSEHDSRNRSETFEDEESKDGKKIAAKKAQSHLKNIPGHIMLAIQKGCKYYFNKVKGLPTDEGKRSGQLNLRCISQVLRKENADLQERFDTFIEGYDSAHMTWNTIMRYIKETGNRELIRVMQEMIENLFAEENANDVENWLQKSKMYEDMKDKIKVEKVKLQKDFLDRLEKAESELT